MASNGLLVRQRMGMQRKAALNRVRGRSALERSMVAPVGGLNTISALSAMPPTDAWEMVNWIPDVGSVRVRPGYMPQSVNMDEVLTVASYESATATKLLSATQTTIYDSSNAQSYVASASAYTELRSTSELTITDAKTGALSLFVRPVTAGRIFGHDRFELIWDGTRFTLLGKNASDTIILDVDSSALDAEKWYSIMLAWDLATTTALLYIDDADDATVNTATNDTLDYDYEDWYVGDLAGDFDVAEIWFDDAFIDFTDSAERDKFIDTTGRPISLGSDGSTPTGAAPLVYLNNAYSSFGTNKGTGEDFTGIPLQALSSPSQIPEVLKTGLNSGRWQTWQFFDVLYLANGVDTLQTYDGSTVSNSTFTGPTMTNIIGGNSFKSRVYVWEDQSTSFWYGGVNSISGSMTEFQLPGQGRLGGYIVSMVTWTHDGGNGPDDYAVFLMSSGEAIVYSGSNPGDSAAWSLVGVFRIGVPMGRRCAIKFAGDVAIQTQEDNILLSEVLRDNIRRTKISGAARKAAELYSTNSGWQVIYYPKGGLMIFNIPVSSSRFDQHVLNLITNAWTKFEDMNARCWEVHDRDLYFGGSDGVYKADSGTSDNGALIAADVKQAWTNMKIAGLKQYTAFRPVMQATGTLTYTASLAYDYGSAVTTVEASQATAGTVWGSPWGSSWSPPIEIRQDWRMASGIGNEVSIRMRVSSRGQEVRWFRTDYLFERGGVL